jgi:hypothetical protein
MGGVRLTVVGNEMEAEALCRMLRATGIEFKEARKLLPRR